MNAIIAGIFSYTETKSHALPFVFFAGMMAEQFFMVLFIYPETKQRSLEQIQAGFGIGQAVGRGRKTGLWRRGWRLGGW